MQHTRTQLSSVRAADHYLHKCTDGHDWVYWFWRIICRWIQCKWVCTRVTVDHLRIFWWINIIFQRKPRKHSQLSMLTVGQWQNINIDSNHTAKKTRSKLMLICKHWKVSNFSFEWIHHIHSLINRLLYRNWISFDPHSKSIVLIRILNKCLSLKWWLIVKLWIGKTMCWFLITALCSQIYCKTIAFITRLNQLLYTFQKWPWKSVDRLKMCMMSSHIIRSLNLLSYYCWHSNYYVELLQISLKSIVAVLL